MRQGHLACFDTGRFNFLYMLIIIYKGGSIRIIPKLSKKTTGTIKQAKEEKCI